MAYDDVAFSVHAIRRMFEKYISESEVRDVLESGELVEKHKLEEYAVKNIHFASIDSRAIHVVSIDDDQLKQTEVVTVYEPDLDHWQPGFRRRKASS